MDKAQQHSATTPNEYEAQAEKFCRKYGVKISARFIKYAPYFLDDKESRDIFRVTVSRGNKSFSIKFGQSLNDSTGNGANKPTAYSVLACITKDDPGTLEQFCSNFGYDTDSRKAEKIYKGVVKEWAKVSDFFTASEIEALQEIN